jgi:hypothetical protein
MKRMGKVVCLFLVLIITLSIGSSIIKSVTAQSIPKPSVPIFKLEFQDDSFRVNSTDYIQNQTIQIKIENQPLVNLEHLLYVIEEKSHYADNWNTTGASFWQDSQSQSTLIVYALKGNNASKDFNGYLEFSNRDSVDFKVQAIGFYDLGPSNGHLQPSGLNELDRSEWSPTKTISIPDGSVSVSSSPTPNPTPIPTVPEFPATLAITFLIVATMALAVVVKRRKKV